MLRVLIVDDARFMRKVIKDIIEDMGCEVVGEARDGEEAINLYMSERPDVVTMDVTMPEMNGIEAVKKIKKIDPDAKIIICSSMGQSEIVLEAIRAGAKDFIVKPFNTERVVEAIRNVYN